MYEVRNCAEFCCLQVLKLHTCNTKVRKRKKIIPPFPDYIPNVITIRSIFSCRCQENSNIVIETTSAIYVVLSLISAFLNYIDKDIITWTIKIFMRDFKHCIYHTIYTTV